MYGISAVEIENPYENSFAYDTALVHHLVMGCKLLTDP